MFFLVSTTFNINLETLYTIGIKKFSYYTDINIFVYFFRISIDIEKLFRGNIF